MNEAGRFLRNVMAFITLSLLILCCKGYADATPVFSVTRVGQIVCFGNNTFDIDAPEDGKLVITIRNNTSVFRTIEGTVSAGKSSIAWDGLGYNRERLTPMTYHIDAVLTGETGNQYEVHFDSPIELCKQALLFALPSAETAYLNDPDGWFFECRAVTGGTFKIQFLQEETEKILYEFERDIASGRISRITLKNILGKKRIEPGVYLIRVYDITASDYTSEFMLHVEEEKPEEEAVFVTGPIMPESEADDEEIWKKMTEPAVVVNIRNHDHQKVFLDPDSSSAVLGTLHGQTQSLEVIRIQDDWVFIQAWNHEEGEMIQGWVPLKNLKVVHPQTEYGLLINKQEQTLTVFRKGERIGTVLVCTGRMVKNALEQETSAGSFLTGEHRVDYSTNGKKYDYVIQYDGGNLIHQIPYAHGTGKKDFTEGRGLLGAKASHACIRIQAEPGEADINAYWIWTHIPMNTRIIILDDPAERKARKAILDGTAGLNELPGKLIYSEEDETVYDESTVVMTFGGNTVLGDRENDLGRSESFMSVISEQGTSYPLSGVKHFFSEDDITILSLCCTLKENRNGEIKDNNGTFRGLPEYTRILTDGSVEFVSLADQHVFDYGAEGYESTVLAIDDTQYLNWCGINTPKVVFSNGHMIGFGSCRETTYLKDPGIIERDIHELQSLGCEFIVYQCHWDAEKDEHHTALQEAMARSCVRSGAGLVIGYHPLAVQGIEYINEIPVIYSLGNLIHGMIVNREGYDGLLVRAAVSFTGESPKVILKLIPILASSENNATKNDYHPVPADKDEASEIIRIIQSDTVPPLE